MTRYLFMLSFFFQWEQGICQVGIGTNTPTATLEVKSNSTNASTKSLEINNSSNIQKLAVYSNGNLEFHGALMPNGNPGNKGEFLFSNGIGKAPEWKTIMPEHTRQIYDVFQGSFKTTTGYINQPANTWVKIGPSTININDTSVGSWNSTTKEFTVSKAGVYIVSFDLSMYIGEKSFVVETAYARLTLGEGYQFLAGIFEDHTNGRSFYWHDVNGETVKRLLPGDKIFVSAYNFYPWQLERVGLQIKYAEL